MALAKVAVNIDGETVEELSLGYEVIGDSGRSWILTPGGRFSKEYPGVRELAQALAELGNRVVIHDRPNTGESDVCFTGSTESAMQADAAAALVSHLGLTPAVSIGGSGGARVSLLTAVRHPEAIGGVAVWMMSGGVYGLMTIGVGYCGASINSVWNGGMESVAKIPKEVQGNWQEVMERNPSNRQKILSQDPEKFRATMQRWLLAYCPCGGLVPGLNDGDVLGMNRPALVVRSGESDPFHTRETSEQLVNALPNAELAEPPWGDTEWIHSKIGYRFVNWHRLAPILNEWANKTL
ncbi:MAG: alpha/beta fold hydrolase [Acidimicrobiales bacterium]